MENDTDVPLDWNAIKRRKFHILIPSVLIFLISVIIAFTLPPVYRSTGTILIEAQGAPRDLIQSTVTGYLEERLEKISQIVLSRNNLLEIIKRFNLYDELAGRHSTEDIVRKMRKAIAMEPIKANRGHTSVITAFTLSYEGGDPIKVAQVADVLARAYLEENSKSRGEKTRGTFKFLEKQLAELRKEIQHAEEQIAQFKDEHINELPELMEFNLQTMEKLEREIETKEEQIKVFISQRIYLEGQLASLEQKANSERDDDRGMPLTEELETLRTLYLSKSATLANEHPDVIDLKKKLDAMEAEMDSRSNFIELRRHLEEKESQLTELSGRFSDQHPDIIILKKEVARLKTELRSLSDEHSFLDHKLEIQEDPIYINLQTQIATTQIEIKAAQRHIELLRKKHEDYQKRVENTPNAERQYQALMRDFSNAQAKYQETQERLMAAREAIGLEESQMAEKFILVDAPATPQSPYKPNKAAILLMGFVLAIGAGIGSGIMAEHMDQSVHQADELAEVSGVTVLAVIPDLKSPRERKGYGLR